MFRVGVIGSTGIGKRHAAGIAGLPRDQARVVAACDLSSEALDGFRESFPETTTYTDHRHMLASENLDIVTVATSDHAHTQLVIDAAQAGAKGVFCEKPLATTREDAAAMVDTCAQAGTKLSVDHTRRWLPLWRTAARLIGEGAIGAVQYIVGSVRGPRAMMFRNGTHSIDSICWMASDAEPEWVVGDLEDGFEHWDQYRGDGGRDPASEPGAYGMIGFAGSIRAFYCGGSKTTPGPKFSTEVIGSTGRLLLTGNDQATLYRGEEPETIDGDPMPVSGIEAGVQDLVQAVEQNRPPTSNGQLGQKVVNILVGMLQSNADGNRPVQLGT